MLRKFINEYKNAMTQYGNAHIVISEGTENFSMGLEQPLRKSKKSKK